MIPSLHSCGAVEFPELGFASSTVDRCAYQDSAPWPVTTSYHVRGTGCGVPLWTIDRDSSLTRQPFIPRHVDQRNPSGLGPGERDSSCCCLLPCLANGWFSDHLQVHEKSLPCGALCHACEVVIDA